MGSGLFMISVTAVVVLPTTKIASTPSNKVSTSLPSLLRSTMTQMLIPAIANKIWFVKLARLFGPIRMSTTLYRFFWLALNRYIIHAKQSAPISHSALTKERVISPLRG